METPDWVKCAKAGDFVVALENIPKLMWTNNEPLIQGFVYELREVTLVPDGFAEEGSVGFRLKDFNHGSSPFTTIEPLFIWASFKPAKPLPKEITCENFIIEDEGRTIKIEEHA